MYRIEFGSIFESDYIKVIEHGSYSDLKKMAAEKFSIDLPSSIPDADLITICSFYCPEKSIRCTKNESSKRTIMVIIKEEHQINVLLSEYSPEHTIYSRYEGANLDGMTDMLLCDFHDCAKNALNSKIDKILASAKKKTIKLEAYLSNILSVGQVS